MNHSAIHYIDSLYKAHCVNHADHQYLLSLLCRYQVYHKIDYYIGLGQGNQN